MAKLPALQSRLQAITPKQPRPPKNNWGTGRGGRPWRRLKAKIHLRDGWACQCCGVVTMELELDHITNVAQGGTDDESNLQSLCVPCHKKKTQAETRGGCKKFKILSRRTPHPISFIKKFPISPKVKAKVKG